MMEEEEIWDLEEIYLRIGEFGMEFWDCVWGTGIWLVRGIWIFLISLIDALVWDIIGWLFDLW